MSSQSFLLFFAVSIFRLFVVRELTRLMKEKVVMISVEPQIKVGICTGYKKVTIRFNGFFRLEGRRVAGLMNLWLEAGELGGVEENGRKLSPRQQLFAQPEGDATFSINDVTIGVNFHWERRRQQTFRGDLRVLAASDNTLTVINEIGLEEYLKSVIASEMSAQAPLEFLKAHAVISRSWLAAMLGRKDKKAPTQQSDVPAVPPEGEIVRWYGREEHENFDVCADDHCQRYQGLPESQAERAVAAVCATHGLFLVDSDEICDSRYHKACGGLTEDFATAWEDAKVPYLTSVSDWGSDYPPVRTDDEARSWLSSSPPAYCNTSDLNVLRQILPAFDQETRDFFRWQVVYSRPELEELIAAKTGRDVGTLLDLIPLARGPSGRIFRLQILGRKASFMVGKELEIRRALSPSHLLSSAFTVSVERDPDGMPLHFTLQGAGWGHGVGLCQIGAAVMAIKGFAAPEILRHYFRGAALQKLY
jgi:stage II sporulation protein D